MVSQKDTIEQLHNELIEVDKAYQVFETASKKKLAKKAPSLNESALEEYRKL
jgi:hypothetical protein